MGISRGIIANTYGKNLGGVAEGIIKKIFEKKILEVSQEEFLEKSTRSNWKNPTWDA